MKEWETPIPHRARKRLVLETGSTRPDLQRLTHLRRCFQWETPTSHGLPVSTTTQPTEGLSHDPSVDSYPTRCPWGSRITWRTPRRDFSLVWVGNPVGPRTSKVTVQNRSPHNLVSQWGGRLRFSIKLPTQSLLFRFLPSFFRSWVVSTSSFRLGVNHMGGRVRSKDTYGVSLRIKSDWGYVVRKFLFENNYDWHLTPPPKSLQKTSCFWNRLIKTSCDHINCCNLLE